MNGIKVYIFILCSSCLLFRIDAQNLEEEIFENFKKGVFTQEKGDFKSALSYFESIKDNESYIFPFTQLRIAQCKDALNQTEEGIHILEELISKNEKESAWSLPVNYHLARYYEKQGNDKLACAYYNKIYPPSFLPWWLAAYLTDCGIFLVNTREFQKVGADCLRKVVNYGGYNPYRKNALLSLCLSSEDEDKIFAIRFLLKSGYLSEAWFILYNNVTSEFLTYVGPSNAIEKWKIFEDAGKGFISQVKQNRQIEYVSLLYEYALRCAISSAKYHIADTLFDLMNNDFPLNFDAGEYLYWAGQKAEKNKSEEHVISYYNLLLNRFPQHKRVPDVLFLLGFWFYNKGDWKKAQKYFETIEKNYPQSSYYSRTIYLLSSIFERKGEKVKAKAYYQKAIQGNIGDYYVHSSAEKLIKGFNSSEEKMKIVPLKHLPVSVLVKNALLSMDDNEIKEQIKTDTELKWLFYFSQLGTEEKEWIAYYICNQIQTGKRDEKVLVLLAHAGSSQVVWDYIYSIRPQGFTDIPEENKNQILFPLPYYKSVIQWAKTMAVDPYLIWSIMKQESSYRTSVISTSNAKGLLQLIPTTSEWVIKKENQLKEIDPLLWKYPDYNIALGTTYFRYLLNRFNGNMIYAIAGYNAGPGRVDQWKKNMKNNDMEAFIENIPFTETRNYVKKVLGNYAGYHSIYKGF
ncbi:MAG: transglycosylase SLT domain-containing protein [Candidatus Hydrogenedens sp.]